MEDAPPPEPHPDGGWLCPECRDWWATEKLYAGHYLVIHQIGCSRETPWDRHQ